jgi:hypothetical protein
MGALGGSGAKKFLFLEIKSGSVHGGWPDENILTGWNLAVCGKLWGRMQVIRAGVHNGL